MSGESVPLLQVDALTKRYGETLALDHLTFIVHPGEIVGLLGPNGAGKTTTMKLLLGLLRPTSGSAHFHALDCTRDAHEVKRRLGYTPDEPAFYDFLSGRETLDFVISVHGLDRIETWAHLDARLDALEFRDALDVQVGGDSLGTKKKLALLVSLAHRPSLLLLDEPTNGLDPGTAARVRALLRQYVSDGASVIVSTHLLDMADHLCDRVLILDHGRLLAEGTPHDVRARAGLAATASLEESFLRLVG